MRKGCGIVIIGLSLLWASVGWGTTYYCSPTGNNSNDGSAADDAHAWARLDSAFDPEEGNKLASLGDGDTVKCTTGYHGFIKIVNQDHTDWITIEPDTGAIVDVNWIYISNSDYWKFSGLRISQSYGDGGDDEAVEADADTYQVYIRNGCNYITVQNCSIFGVPDTNEYSLEDWAAIGERMIYSDSKQVTISGNTMYNMLDGIVCYSGGSAEYLTIDNNRIYNITNDSMKPSGDHVTIQDNYIHDFYDYGENHSDCIQVVTLAVVTNWVVQRNIVIAVTDSSRDPEELIDTQGFYWDHASDTLVENNLVVVPQNRYGMTLNKASSNVTYLNNTICSPYGYSGSTSIHPDIEIHEDSTGIIIRNNVAGQFSKVPLESPRVPISDGGGFTFDHNIEWQNDGVTPLETFVNYENNNFIPKSSSVLDGTGSLTDAPSDDILGESRPVGGIDIGCYEIGTRYLLFFTGG